MRLCEHEGEFLPGVYFALCEKLSWAETQRIMTSMTVLGDERADYGEWYLKNAPRLRKQAERQGQQVGKVISLDDYRRELAENRMGFDNASGVLSKHRSAVAQGLGEAEGLLPPDEVEFVETVRDVHAGKIDLLESVIAERAHEIGASLHDE